MNASTKEYKGYKSTPMYEGYIETNISENCGYSKLGERMNMSATLVDGRRGYIEITWII